MNYPIREVVTNDAAFPMLLREIPNPPERLYVRGSFKPDTMYLSVVGSRKMSSYGRSVCEKLIHELRGLPITIVSGLALGVDACAHAEALKAGLHCVAVPGSAIGDTDIVPKSNYALSQQILRAGGELVSEYAQGYVVQKHSFPQRNRIMAGMSHATLLIEAGEKSGTLITARLAVDFNRELLVVPGSIFSEMSAGVHQFLKLGATPVTCGNDIIDALGLTSVIKKDDTYAARSVEEQLVLDQLSEPCDRDTLLEKTLLEMHILNVLLSTLELEGLVTIRGGIVYKI